MTSREYTVEFLARVLLDDGLISDRQQADVVRNEQAIRKRILRKKAASMRARQVRYEVSPAEVIAASGFNTPEGKPLTEDRIMVSLSGFAGLDYLKLDPLKLNERLITETMSRPFARRHVCLPIERKDDGAVVFAIDNPWDLNLQESLRTLVPGGYELRLTSKSDILRIITDVYGFRKAVVAAEAKIAGGVEIGNLEQLVKLSLVEDLEATDQHVVSAVEFLLRYAFEQRASDIHLEPKRDEAHVRLRIDGVLHTVYRMPMVVHRAMVSRLKTLARMDIAERRRPQDGRIKTSSGDGRETELRVSAVPIAFGEKIVMRVFDPNTMKLDLEALGFFESELHLWQDFISRTHGLVLITGPTGSGKTTTLYSTLRLVSSPDVNVTTIEDPIEMVDGTFNQILVQPKIDVTFANALRSVLRQDPDIIMVGEIRDGDTAEMAVQAALTGHLVFSTVHTNDAPSAIVRLLDLGVPPFLISSTLVGVMAQRLVRKICEYCKKPATLTRDEASLLGLDVGGNGRELPVSYGEGCNHCRGTGFYGRAGVFEVMPVDAGLKSLISSGATGDELRAEATANGMVSLRDAGIRKLALGITSFDEVLRILGDHGA